MDRNSEPPMTLDRTVCAVPLKAVRNAVLEVERSPSMTNVQNLVAGALLFICERLDSIEISQRMIAEATLDQPEV